MSNCIQYQHFSNIFWHHWWTNFRGQGNRVIFKTCQTKFKFFKTCIHVRIKSCM